MNNIQLSGTANEAYFLGFLWADGCVSKTNNIQIEITRDDGEALSSIFTNPPFSMIKKYIHRIRGNRKPGLLFYKGCKQFCKYLIEHKYREKSSSPSILTTIPIELQKYWWRGFSDGDGCFYVGSKKNHGCYQYSITGPYDQDWKFVEELFQSKQINYHITRIINTSSKKSYIKTGAKLSGKLFGDFIYQGFEEDKIGLQRKYEKYLQFK